MKASTSTGAQDYERGERWTKIGVFFVGSILLGPIGIPFLVYGALYLRRAQMAGYHARPWHVTAIGASAIIAAGGNFLGWSLDMFAGRTGVYENFFAGFGRMFNAAYFLDINTTYLGGTAAPGEKSYIIMAVFMLWPMRLVAAWGFLQGQRWSFHFMKVTAWASAIFYFGWIANMAVHFDHYLGAEAAPLYGVIGWWIYITPWLMEPVIMLLYFYTVDPKSVFPDREFAPVGATEATVAENAEPISSERKGALHG